MSTKGRKFHVAKLLSETSESLFLSACKPHVRSAAMVCSRKQLPEVRVVVGDNHVCSKCIKIVEKEKELNAGRTVMETVLELEYRCETCGEIREQGEALCPNCPGYGDGNDA